MVNLVYDTLLLKVVVLTQVILSTWGYLTPPEGFFMPATYAYSHSILVLLGVLCIVKTKSTDIVLMYLAVNIFTILNDIILLGLYQPLADSGIEKPLVPSSTKNTYRFALGMSIVNLILKPVICFILYKIYTTRGGELPSELCTIRVVNGNGGGYDNIDASVEVASPHQIVDHSTPHA